MPYVNHEDRMTVLNNRIKPPTKMKPPRVSFRLSVGERRMAVKRARRTGHSTLASYFRMLIRQDSGTAEAVTQTAIQQTTGEVYQTD